MCIKHKYVYKHTRTHTSNKYKYKYTYIKHIHIHKKLAHESTSIYINMKNTYMHVHIQYHVQKQCFRVLSDGRDLKMSESRGQGIGSKVVWVCV
jgi:hypothetical protein